MTLLYIFIEKCSIVQSIKIKLYNSTLSGFYKISLRIYYLQFHRLYYLKVMFFKRVLFTYLSTKSSFMNIRIEIV